MEKRKKRGCGKLRGKRGKLFGESGKIEFSTGFAGAVFRCVERLTGIRAKCDNPCRRSGDGRRNPTGFPAISDGFGSSFPIRVVPKPAEKPFRNGFLRNFWVFHSLHTPYYDYYDLISSFFPSSFLPPRTENSVCGLARICRTVPPNRNDTRVVPYNVTFPTVYAPCRGAIRRERPAFQPASVLQLTS